MAKQSTSDTRPHMALSFPAVYQRAGGIVSTDSDASRSPESLRERRRPLRALQRLDIVIDFAGIDRVDQTPALRIFQDFRHDLDAGLALKKKSIDGARVEDVELVIGQASLPRSSRSPRASAWRILRSSTSAHNLHHHLLRVERCRSSSEISAKQHAESSARSSARATVRPCPSGLRPSSTSFCSGHERNELHRVRNGSPAGTRPPPGRFFRKARRHRSSYVSASLCLLPSSPRVNLTMSGAAPCCAAHRVDRSPSPRRVERGGGEGHSAFPTAHRPRAHQLELPALGGRAFQVEVAGQEIEPLRVLALRGAEPVLEIEGRRGLVVERRLDRGGRARELGAGRPRRPGSRRRPRGSPDRRPRR